MDGVVFYACIILSIANGCFLYNDPTIDGLLRLVILMLMALATSQSGDPAHTYFLVLCGLIALEIYYFLITKHTFLSCGSIGLLILGSVVEIFSILVKLEKLLIVGPVFGTVSGIFMLIEAYQNILDMAMRMHWDVRYSCFRAVICIIIEVFPLLSLWMLKEIFWQHKRPA